MGKTLWNPGGWLEGFRKWMEKMSSGGHWLRRILGIYLILFAVGGGVVAAQLVTGAQASLTSENEAVDSSAADSPSSSTTTTAEVPTSDPNSPPSANQDPETAEVDPTLSTATVKFLFLEFSVSGLTLVLVYISAMGLIGGAIQGVRAVAEHRIGDDSQEDKDKWNSSYAMWYLVLPVLGAVNALILYLVFAAGFIGSVGDTSSLNFYGVSAVAIFGGLFSQKAFQKFAQVFDVAVGIGDK